MKTKSRIAFKIFRKADGRICIFTKIANLQERIHENYVWKWVEAEIDVRCILKELCFWMKNILSRYNGILMRSFDGIQKLGKK